METPQDSAKATISQLEKDIKEHDELDTAIANILIADYESYYSDFPEDSISPYYISRAADIYKEMPGKVLKSITTYNRVIKTYPEHPLAARSTFMIGFVFDTKLNDKERAAKSYTHFIETYPNDPMKADAQNLLNMIQDTLSPEQMVEMWKQKNNVDTNSNSK